MRKRIRNLLALLLCISLLAAESCLAFAENGVAETEAAGDVEILGTGSGTVSGYTITGDLEYGRTATEYRPEWTWNNCPFKLTDKNGNEFKDYAYLRITSLSFGGKEYSYLTRSYTGYDTYEEYQIADFYSAYEDGLKVGDKVDLTVSLGTTTVIPGGPNITTEIQTNSAEGIIKNVEITKNKITQDQHEYNMSLSRGKRLERSLKDNRFYAHMIDSGFGNTYMKLTEAGLKKVGNFSEDKYELSYGDDFTLFVEGYNGEKYVDVTENYEFDLAGAKLTVFVYDSYSLGTDFHEIQAGTSAEKFREIVKKHAYLYKNDVKQEADFSMLELTSFRTYTKMSSNSIPLDDEAITEALSETGKSISFRMELELNEKDEEGEPIIVDGSGGVFTRKNAYNIYLDTFEEVAHTTGASYERTKHDFMVNLYAIKNENDAEKIRVGSLGEKETFMLRVWNADGHHVTASQNDIFFSGIKAGDEVEYRTRWFIPISDDDREELGGKYFYYEDDLKFYAYDSSKDLGNPGSDAHKTDGQNVDKLPEGAPVYEFNAETYNTLVAGVKVNIADKFESYVSLNGYVESAKHRYTVDNKKIAKVDKKGNVVPKKSGTIKISLEQKAKGSAWTKIGDPIELFVQVPEMKKDAEGTVGKTMDAKEFLGKTTFAPTSWKSSKPAVAEIDEKTGIITFKKKGKVKIIAVYGVGKLSSKNKYKTKVKVNG